MNRDPWWERGTCVVERIPPIVFFPTISDAYDLAVEVCQRCPVSRLCYEDSATKRDVYGVSGGIAWRAAADRQELQLAEMVELWTKGIGMDGLAIPIPLPTRTVRRRRSLPKPVRRPDDMVSEHPEAAKARKRRRRQRDELDARRAAEVSA